MKKYLKNHPIITASLLAVLIVVITSVLSVLSGQHYYYRIYNDGAEITDVKIREVTYDGEPLDLLEETSVDYGKDSTIVYFDAVKSGSGILSITYTRHTRDGRVVEMMKNIKLYVSRLKVIYVGEGIYNHNGNSDIHNGITIYSLLMILYFIWRRRGLAKITRYSYAYISTWSGQLFFTGIFLAYAITAAVSIIKLNYVDVTMMGMVTSYLMLALTALTFPVVVVFAISMTVSNISLIRHEGKRFSNMLGIISGLGLLGVVAVIMALFVLFVSYGRENVAIAVLYSIVNAFYVVFLCVLSASIVSGLLAGHYTPSMKKDYIIILGCAIREDGTLYPLIRGRVDRAITFWKEQEQKIGKKAVFVPSGGKGNDEIISEGEAMKRYLLEQGIEEEYILAETKSTTTYENMKFSKELIESVHPSAHIAFSTTNYHVMRSGILAEEAGLHAEGMGAPTKWYFWPNALLREVAGMFAYQPKMQILTMLILALLAGITGYAYYLFL